MTPAPAITEPPKDKAWHSRSVEEVMPELISAATGILKSPGGMHAGDAGR